MSSTAKAKAKAKAAATRRSSPSPARGSRPSSSGPARGSRPSSPGSAAGSSGTPRRPQALAKWRALPHRELGTWVPPSSEVRLEAIGLDPTDGGLQHTELYAPRLRSNSKHLEMQRLLEPAPTVFVPRSRPQPGEWMYSSQELPQSFEDYVKERPNVPSRLQSSIYVLPFSEPGLDPRKVGSFPDLDVIGAFIEAWFSLPCKMLPPNAVHKRKGVKVRNNGHGKDKQYLGSDILRELRAFLPRDAYCVIGITMDDLWSGDLNFVFGVASIQERTGVFSFCRMDPAWYRVNCRMDMKTMKIISEYPSEREEGDADVVLRRAHGVLSHELGHQFGIRHCQFFQCRMQGSNGLDESDNKLDTTDLCPVCLRKLSWCIASGTQKDAPDDPAAWCIDRYKRLLAHCDQVGPPLADYRRWLVARLAQLDGASESDTLELQAAPPKECADEAKREEDSAANGSSEAVEAAGADVRLMHIFREHDKDGDGRMEADAFRELLLNLDESFPAEKLQSLFEAADANRDGVLDVHEFLNWLLTPQEDPSQVEQCLKARMLAETQLVRCCSGSCSAD